ncbi:MAG: STAS domain-containing protein [Melioribacteraceae bacterium]|nr:STAS domain-containing protein [Melioribacteraceae bacterium]MCF8412595.1 STAS domain-containing protein [Melioribacteraceae bacterium]
MSSEFNLKSEQRDNCIVVETTGYINNIGGQKLVEEFSKHHNEGNKNFVFNLAQSKIVNSIGISFLIEVIEKLNDTGGKLIFSNLDPTIDKTFNIMGLFQYAQKADDVESALKSF